MSRNLISIGDILHVCLDGCLGYLILGREEREKEGGKNRKEQDGLKPTLRPDLPSRIHFSTSNLFWSFGDEDIG
jgi:hypothetical protein